MALSHEPNLELLKTKGIADLIYIKKVISIIKYFHFHVCIFQDQPWNLPDFMKFAWFHHKICQISPWNPLDFMNSGFFFRTNTDIRYYMVYHWMLYFSSEPKSLAWNLPNFMKSTRFHHEICQISWIVDFSSEPIQIYSITWSTTECCIFHQNQSPWHEICQISCMKSAEFHAWNPLDFMVYH